MKRVLEGTILALRGGSWLHLTYNVRPAARGGFLSRHPGHNVTLRLVRRLPCAARGARDRGARGE